MKGEKILYDEHEFPTYRIEYEAESHVVNFSVFEVQGAYGTEPPWEIADEEPVLNGHVKWDGCSNWDYLTSECMAHCCGVKDVRKLGDLQVALYSMAAQLMIELGTTYVSENIEEFVPQE